MSRLSEHLESLPQRSRVYKLSVLPEMLAQAGQFDRLYTVLSDFEFIELKIFELGINALIQDYDCAETSEALNSQEYDKEKSIDLRIIKNVLMLLPDMVEKEGVIAQMREQLLLHLKPFAEADRPLIGKLLEQIGDRGNTES